VPTAASPLLDDARRVVWATVTTVDPGGRPRGRVFHPVWVRHGGGCDGWVLTRPTPAKTRHLAVNRHVSCAYLASDHDVAFFDCVATWIDDVDRRRQVWAMIASTPPPVGYDPATIVPDGVNSREWALLHLCPFRIQVARGADLAAGQRPRLWRAEPVPSIASAVGTPAG
jgi:hypothetical protein